MLMLSTTQYSQDSFSGLSTVTTESQVSRSLDGCYLIGWWIQYITVPGIHFSLICGSILDMGPTPNHLVIPMKLFDFPSWWSVIREILNWSRKKYGSFGGQMVRCELDMSNSQQENSFKQIQTCLMIQRTIGWSCKNSRQLPFNLAELQ